MMKVDMDNVMCLLEEHRETCEQHNFSTHLNRGPIPPESAKTPYYSVGMEMIGGEVIPLPKDVMKVYDEDWQKKEETRWNKSRRHFRSGFAMFHSSPTYDWLIENVLERGTITQLFGASYTYKSFVLLDKACCIASGKDWAGHKIVKPGPVVLLIGEGGNGYDRRFQAWCKENEVVPGPEFPLYRSKIPANLANADSMLALTEAMNLISDVNPVFIGIDTLHKSSPGADENSSKDMGEVMGEVSKLARQFGAAVEFVHHTGLQDKSRGRGSSSIYAGVDNEYNVDSPDSMQATVTCTKLKDGREPEVMAFTAVEHVLGWQDGHEVTSLAMQYQDPRKAPGILLADKHKLTGHPRQGFIALFDAGGKLEESEWKEACGEVMDASRRFPDVVKSLVKNRKLVKRKNNQKKVYFSIIDMPEIPPKCGAKTGV